MEGLSGSDLSKYWESGFISPIDVFTSSETQRFRQEFESLEHRFGGQDRARSFTTDIHLIQRWAWDVATNPRILACVSGVLGDNVLLWSTNWFIKEPGDRKIVSFHQDASYWGLGPHEVITAWIALSDAPTESGPMVFIPGSHKGDLIDHEDTYAPNNLLTRGQVVKKDLSDKELIEAPLKAGQMSLHHVRTIHGSRANTSDDRRIGMVLRYCSARVKQTKGADTAVLVSGKDEHQHFELLNKPRNDLGETEMMAHKKAITQMERLLMTD